MEENMENGKGKEQEVEGTQPEACPAPKKEDKVAELTETLQRLQAEFENFRKRTEKEKADHAKYAHKQIVIQLLPILDNFELALKNSPKDNDHIKGFELIYAQLFDMLVQSGLEKIETLGKQFNPATMEALLQDDSDKDKGTVLEELQKGYLLHGYLLRHAKVSISK